MELHPYDGQTRRLRHDDPDPTEGRAIVARLLGVELGELAYDLSFYSGGLGALDHLAVAGSIDAERFEATCRRLDAVRAEDGLLDPEWGEELGWLLECESRAPGEAALDFVRAHRREFQPACDASAPIRFVRGSNVNDWCLLYRAEGRLAYVACSQG